VYPGVLRTWAPTGSQNVSVSINGNETDSFTIVAAIIAARTKLSLCLIANRKKLFVENSSFGDVGYHHADHSESGWQTAETFTRWINWLCQIYDDAEPIWVILDCYSVDRQEAMRGDTRVRRRSHGRRFAR
jgi:hypothetical protein